MSSRIITRSARYAMKGLGNHEKKHAKLRCQPLIMKMPKMMKREDEPHKTRAMNKHV